MIATLAIGLGLMPTFETTPKDALKDLFLSTGRLRGIEARVDFYSRNSSSTPLGFDGEARIYFESSSKFRVEMNSSWGDSTVVVRNGDTVLTDAMYQGGPITLEKSGDSVTSAYYGFGPQQDWTMVLLFMLEGEAGYKKLVGDKAEEVFVQAPEGFRTIKFKSSQFGGMTMTYRVTGGNKDLVQVDFDNLPYRQSRYEQFPQWVSPPQDPLNRQVVSLRHRRLKEDLFSVAPMKGLVVTDLRPKKPG